MSNIDLSQLSAQELQAELQKRQDAQAENRKAYKDLVNKNLFGIVEQLKLLSDDISKKKLFIFQSLKTFLDLKNEVYEVKGEQQSHTFSDDDGNTITYGFRTIDNWDDTVNADVEKVRDFISSLAKDDNSAKLVDVINRLLRKDAKGNLKASRVLELNKIAEEFNSPEFTDAVKIIAQAYKPQQSAFFVDASYTDAQGKKVSIPLNISAVDFPEGTNIADLFPVHEKYNNL
ncbi:DUF3164 family protein [Capnocytophaga felis]|uniref:DUF3164 domain-containing protein n=1 Tax=Capnocytophaga felis TaxID=2267611 RepID=A0A5M4BB64_9FLAO|nr:DUF3164 family protein [Capnocytophaga felis]GET46477.1 hypothetical protein RCZ01_17790 [Capnocytophaga felis]GET48367.1 hypothetical protein RCZ02_11980 [Capnocytophaga felis]